MRKKPSDHRAMLGATILHLRSRRAVSRSALAKVIGASTSTLCVYVDMLIAQGWVQETGLGTAVIGRPQRLLGLRADAGWFAGIEFNAQRVQAVCVDFGGTVRQTMRTDLPETADATRVLRVIFELLEAMIASQSAPLLGIGLGVPGLVDRERGVGRYFSFVRHWRDVPVTAILRERFPQAITLENNLRVTALAERWFGGGGRLRDYVILGPRSGFGLAIMHDGQLMHGAHEMAGEVGLWAWPQPHGTQSLHDVLSATAVYRRMAGLSEGDALPSDLRSAFGELAVRGTPAWEETLNDYARVIRSVQLIVDPEVFFLHGPLTALGQDFCSDIEAAVAASQPSLPDLKVSIRPSTLGDDAGALGAASLAMEVWDPTLA
jgi:predicted NBD/HSP70 family sugar kinase